MKAITLYVVLAFAFSSVFYALIIASGHVGGGNGWYASGLDWCPAAAALLTCTLLSIDMRAAWADFRMARPSIR
jgi:hypothetical protein